MNISSWIDENPFKIVFCLVLVFMFFITKEDMRAIKHRKHREQIEEKKKKKALKL